MRKLITAIIVFVAATAALLFAPKSAKAACVPECSYRTRQCGSCRADPDGCYMRCRDVYDCLSSACTWYTKYGSYYDASCSLPDVCGSCDCSGRRTCYEQCSEREYSVVCTKPAWCPTPTPTPTTDPLACLYGDCGFSGATYGTTCGDTQAERDAGVGDTCIHLISPANTCKCTEETDPASGNYVCEPYRDPQVVDGVCYQQWECCKDEGTPKGIPF